MNDEDLIPISALQHYLYCQRQCALIHIERQWAESRHTAEGRLLHKKTDQPAMGNRKGVRTVTAMPLVDMALGITGIADVVEYHRENGIEYPFPVEYKRGYAKTSRVDEVQLCAQALCLESMSGLPVYAGALFYGETCRRHDVTFGDELRALTRQTIADTRSMIESGRTPVADYNARRCDACSLLDLCQPHRPNQPENVQSWLNAQLEE